MRYTSAQEFFQEPAKRITLMGMSGIGKTRHSAKIRKQDWFHYSADYRIATYYLNEEINDELKKQAMKNPNLAELLRSDSIFIHDNVTVDNLAVVSNFLGKVGKESERGLSLDEFKRRQELYREAEKCAMKEVSNFIKKAEDIYGYKNFINDSTGSLCEIIDVDDMEHDAVLQTLVEHTLIVYLEPTEEDIKRLLERAKAKPKPLLYQSDFFDQSLKEFMDNENIKSVNEVFPDKFVLWVFPKLIEHRMPRYKAIADAYGYTVSAEDTRGIKTEDDFVKLIAEAIA